MKKYNIYTILMTVAGIGVLIGALLPWATMFRLSVRGIDGSYGKSTAILGLLMLIMLWISILVNNKKIKVIPMVSMIILSIVIICISVDRMSAINSIKAGNEFGFLVSISNGLYVTLLSGILGLTSTIYKVLRDVIHNLHKRSIWKELIPEYL